MRVLERLNLFWLGAGGLLAFFGADELVAFKLTREPRWLGGNAALAGDILATLTGIAIMYGLGIREPLEGTARPTDDDAAPTAGDVDPTKEDDLGEPA